MRSPPLVIPDPAMSVPAPPGLPDSALDTADVSVIVTLEVDGHVATLPDPSGGTFDAAGDFDRLLQFAYELPMLSRIDEYDDMQFSGSELASVRDEVSSLLKLARSRVLGVTRQFLSESPLDG